MRIQTLGGLSARNAAGLLVGEAAQPRRLALLALLARAGDRGISRERLLGFLWPDTDEERARRTLSQALYALRQGLGSEELFIGTQELRLNPSVISSDLDEFSTARRDGNWGRAAELYAGPFLDGFHLPGTGEFERWVESERESLNQEYAELLERLATRADSDGEYRVASGWWRKLATLDPLNGRIALSLMRSLAAAGDRSAALRHARVYQALVQEELDIPADREVLALAERIKAEAAQPVPGEPGKSGTARPALTAEVLPVAGPAVSPLAQSTAGTMPAPLVEVPARVEAPRKTARWALLVPVLLVLVALVLLLRPRGQPSSSAPASPLLMVGRITDYGPGPTGGVGRPLADMIATDLARVQSLRVISTARVYELLAQLGASDTATAGFMNAARHAGARQLLDGALFHLGGGRIRLDLRRVEVETGAVLGAYSVQGSDPFGLADSITARLVSDLGVTAPGGMITDVTTSSLDAYRAYEAGLRDYYRLDFAVAERHFRDALEADSNFAMAAYYNALASQDATIRLTRLNEAYRLAGRAGDRGRLLISAVWARSHAAPNTRALAETLAVRYPAELDGHLVLGYALWNAEEYPAAFRSFTRVVEMDSLGLRGRGVRCAACEAYSNLIAGYAGIDSFETSARMARAWAASQPSNPVPVRQLGILSHHLRDTAAAARYLLESRALDTSTANHHLDSTIHLWLQKRYAEVERADRARLALSISYMERIDVLWDLMLSLTEQGRFEESLKTASTLLREVETGGYVERDGHPFAVTMGLVEAQGLRRVGRLGEAAARFNSLSRLETPSGTSSLRASGRMWIYAHLASTLYEARDTARLARLVERMDSIKTLSGAPRDLKFPRYARGLLEAARGRDGAAYDAFREASFIGIDGFAPARIERARAALRLGRAREAVSLLQRLMYSSHHWYYTHTELHQMLAEAWTAAGNRDSARAHLQEAERAWRNADPPAQARLAELRQRLALQ